MTSIRSSSLFRLMIAAAALIAAFSSRAAEPGQVHRLLYVATPGIRDELQYGGHGVLVFDIDDGHKFLRRIPAAGVGDSGKPMNVKGVCANAQIGRLYVSTLRTLTCFDLATDKILWEKPYEGGCDRMSMSPDGKTIYLPSLEGPHWNVVDASSGERAAKVILNSSSHNTVFGPDGSKVYLAGLKSPILSIADAKTHAVAGQVGPFSNFVRPFTVNGAQTLCFANVNELLGFEIGDLRTGKVLHRVEVQGFAKGAVKRHGCPSHGVGLTPDEKEVWVSDGFNKRVHVFNATTMPPTQTTSIELRDEPGWVTFTLDGQYAYPSTGDVIDAKTKRIIAHLTDETGAAVESEKMVEIEFVNGRPSRAGDQFGVGRVDVSAAIFDGVSDRAK